MAPATEDSGACRQAFPTGLRAEMGGALRLRYSGYVVIAVSGLLAGCENSSANPAGRASAENPSRPVEPEPGVAPTPATSMSPPAPHPLTMSRTITRDEDADGVDDYRAVITEAFDAAGNLLSRTKAQDFDADGIVDARTTTSFEVPAGPATP